MKSFTAILAAGALALPVAAFGQPVTGPYVSLGVGLNYFQSQSIKSYSIPAYGIVGGSLGSSGSNIDYGLDGAIGYGLGNGIRLEAEGDFLHGTFSKTAGVNATQEAYGGFANVLYDFDLSGVGLPELTPYLGFGVGYQEAQVNGSVPVLGYNVNINSNGNGEFAVQGIAGVAFAISDFPGLALTLEYHFVAMPSNLTYNASIGYGGAQTPIRFKTDGLYSHTGLVGMRYAFMTAPPPPPPPPAPPPPPPPPEAARTYLVFFDWDRADLTDRARQIVAEAAQASTHVKTTRIEVNGYTDLSGTASYNQKLSVRRARSVEAELVKDGVAQNDIEIHGYGESNPLVPTAQGVREPQNRRVEIILK
jgi:outer membrane protein OmpA-like peptidoglycan-associated protein